MSNCKYEVPEIPEKSKNGQTKQARKKYDKNRNKKIKGKLLSPEEIEHRLKYVDVKDVYDPRSTHTVGILALRGCIDPTQEREIDDACRNIVEWCIIHDVKKTFSQSIYQEYPEYRDFEFSEKQVEKINERNERIMRVLGDNYYYFKYYFMEANIPSFLEKYYRKKLRQFPQFKILMKIAKELVEEFNSKKGGQNG